MFGTFMIVFFAVLVVLAVIGLWIKKNTPQSNNIKEPDKVLENVADLADNFNRARYQEQDGQ
ncbi:hypothetical protein [Aristaeella hokkaidonensis]|uniref:Uncharacterized protein n=1 Tax=Aristaeella hokkaidonensis TaxID=3046382 RepID=A0AC61MW47_9FIRM|nr:hypothetical protein [Aristaeella hokkaidonensis]QUC66897.1 hypothetical protein JYE49_13810 [Aristaeella hokkaidonensis]SNT94474.1 hypothetical protein SAMN06297421_105133 [Aristaeella hokkaidonensis]